MNVSAELMLWIGLGALAMYVGVFCVSAWLTVRNRRVVNDALSNKCETNGVKDNMDAVTPHK